MLIELLVVIVIIGILAAIALPSFLAHRAKAYDASAKAMVRHAQTAIETHGLAKQTYVGATVAALRVIDPHLNQPAPPTLAAPSALSATGYVVIVTSRTGNTFRITRATTGVVTRVCTRSNQRGGCPAVLRW